MLGKTQNPVGEVLPTNPMIPSGLANTNNIRTGMRIPNVPAGFGRGVGSNSNTMGLPAVNDPEQAYADLTRREYMDFINNYGDFEREVLNRAQTDTSLIDQARQDTQIASALTRGVNERNASRYGMNLTPAQKQQIERTLQRSNTLGGIQAVNDARIAQDEANTALLSDLINIGQGVNRSSQQQLGTSAQNANQLNNAYRSAKAQSKVNTINTVSSLATAAIFALAI